MAKAYGYMAKKKETYKGEEVGTGFSQRIARLLVHTRHLTSGMNFFCFGTPFSLGTQASPTKYVCKTHINTYNHDEKKHSLAA